MSEKAVDFFMQQDPLLINLSEFLDHLNDFDETLENIDIPTKELEVLSSLMRDAVYKKIGELTQLILNEEDEDDDEDTGDSAKES